MTLKFDFFPVCTFVSIYGFNSTGSLERIGFPLVFWCFPLVFQGPLGAESPRSWQWTCSEISAKRQPLSPSKSALPPRRRVTGKRDGERDLKISRWCFSSPVWKCLEEIQVWWDHANFMVRAGVTRVSSTGIKLHKIHKVHGTVPHSYPCWGTRLLHHIGVEARRQESPSYRAVRQGKQQGPRPSKVSAREQHHSIVTKYISKSHTRWWPVQDDPVCVVNQFWDVWLSGEYFPHNVLGMFLIHSSVSCDSFRQGLFENDYSLQWFHCKANACHCLQ